MSEQSSQATASDAVLETRGLTKQFGPVIALRGVSITVRAGEIHSLCGENGAGKSTLIKVLSGVYPEGTYGGQLYMDGTEQRHTCIGDAEAAGLCVIHQELALVPEMTVAENIFLGHEPTRGGFIDRDRMDVEAQKLVDQFGVNLRADSRICDLGIGHQQLVEIAKALQRRSRILILDEPTAALTEQEVAVLLRIVKGLANTGVGCVYVSHKLDEVFAISDRITVLRDGESIITLDVPTTTQDTVVTHMVGRSIENLFPRRRGAVGKVALEVNGLSASAAGNAGTSFYDVSFSVRQGEVLGIGGLMGAGRTEVLMHLFGAWGKRVTGDAKLLGEPLHSEPGDCLRQGLALVSEDRKHYGLVLEQSVGFNLSLSSLDRLSKLGWVDVDSEVTANRRYVTAMKIKANNLETVVGTLSGGNQQKVVLGKIMMTEPKVVLLDEPTRGIDVGAKVEVYELINELTAQGVAVVLVSSELPELIGMSDRIVMLAEGRVGGRFDERPFQQTDLMKAAMPKDASKSGAPGPASASQAAVGGV